jgi:hemerythrin-like domain-containing protein
MHTEDEEGSLFPRLEGKLAPEQAALVDSLESDHQEADRLYVSLKALAARISAAPEADENLRDEYRTTVTCLCELYRRHILQEDTHLMEIGRQVLTAAELEEISREMKRRRGLTGPEPA